MTTFSADKSLLSEHWQSGRVLPPLFLTHLGLSPGADLLYSPCCSAITMTHFLYKTVFSKLVKESRLVQELLKETIPLSLSMRTTKSCSRNFMHLFLPSQRNPTQAFQGCWTLELRRKLLCCVSHLCQSF